MKRWIEHWQRLPADVRRTLLIGLVALLAVFYAGYLWKTNKALGEVRYALEKQEARNRSLGPRAKLPPAMLGSDDPTRIARELKTLQERLAQADQSAYNLRRQFLDYQRADAPEQLQALKDQLTRLAEAGDMELIGLTHVFARKEDRDRAASIELLRQAAQANRFGRPLLQLRTRASYAGLMAFLRGLETLPWVVSPVSTDISVRSDERVRDERGEPMQWLDVEFQLAI